MEMFLFDLYSVTLHLFLSKNSDDSPHIGNMETGESGTPCTGNTEISRLCALVIRRVAKMLTPRIGDTESPGLPVYLIQKLCLLLIWGLGAVDFPHC
jgi:hypothetical protein